MTSSGMVRSDISLRGWWDNRSIGIKVAAAPVMALTALILVAVGAYVALENLRTDFRKLNDEAFVPFEEAARLEAALGRGHAALFRFTSLSASESDVSR